MADDESPRPRKWAWIVLFVSSTTLVCCALPILLVSIGLGAVSASLFAAVPFLVTLARHKALMFVGSGVLLAVSAWLLFRPGRACPTDPQLAEQCEKAYRWNIKLYWVSIAVWAIGFATAYLALPVYLWLAD